MVKLVANRRVERLIQVALLVAGVIHVLPLAGVLGAPQLGSLYGIPFQEANLVILMRHRAVLLGVLGVLFIYAAFRPAVQGVALAAGLVSVTTFVWLAWSSGDYNPAIAKVVTADLAALACLLAAIAIRSLRKPG